MITEEQKQEADRIVSRYKYLYDVIHTEVDAIRCAIQDRQSVLEENKSMLEMIKLHGTERIRMPLLDRIQSLTNQIDYLKTKI